MTQTEPIDGRPAYASDRNLSFLVLRVVGQQAHLRDLQQQAEQARVACAAAEQELHDLQRLLREVAGAGCNPATPHRVVEVGGRAYLLRLDSGNILCDVCPVVVEKLHP